MLRPDLQHGTLLEGLSSFWQTLFADRSQLQHLYASTEVQLGQAYLDLLTQILNMSLDDIPVFNKEYWSLITFRRHLMRTGASSTFPYEYPLPSGVVVMPLLSNQVLTPTILLEQGIDYDVSRSEGVIRFKADPFAIQGLASRLVTVEPVTYATGAAGSYVSGTPARFTVSSELAAGKLAQTYGSDVITLATPAMLPAYVGAQISIVGGVVSPAQTHTIIEVVSPTQLRIDSNVVAEVGLSWQVNLATRFTAQDVGTTLTIIDPTDRNRTQTLAINTVVSGLVVDLEAPIALFTGSTTGVPWTHQSAVRVPQISLWASDVLRDLDNLYKSFGSLIRRKEVSSESYKALIRGIWALFVEGPALPRIEAALNLFVGIPVVQSVGEVVSGVDTTSSTLEDYVTTQVRTYAVPKGSLKDSVVVGASLRAFESLTDVFTATDAIRDPDWFYSKRVPPELIVNYAQSSLPIDPQLYPNPAVGARPLIVSEPRVFIGADETGLPVVEIKGKDGDVGDTSTDLRPALPREDVLPYLAGRALSVSGQVDTALAVTLSSSLDPQISSTIDILAQLASRTVSVEVGLSGADVLSYVSGRPWDRSDVGRACRVAASSNPLFVGETLSVVKIYGAQRVLVAFTDAALAGTLVAGQTLTLVKLLDWEIYTRKGLRHNLGFNVTQDLLSKHILYLSYDITQYAVPYLRSQADVRDVLLAGKSAYTYLYLEAAATIADQLAISDGVDIGLTTYTQLVNANPGIVAGTPLGAYHYHAGSAFAWVDIVRDDQLGALTELSWADQADQLAFSAQFEGWSPGDSVDVVLYVHNGVTFVPMGVAFTLDKQVSNLFTTPSARTRVAVEATVNGTPTRVSVMYGMSQDPAGTIVGFVPATNTSTTGSSAGGAVFSDANFEFHDFDIYRELHIELGGARVTYRIRGRIDAHTVYLVLTETGAPAVIPAASGYSWAMGAPRRFATPAVISGPNVYVDMSGSPYPHRVVDWPVAMLFAEPHNIGAATGTAILTGTANATVS